MLRGTREVRVIASHKREALLRLKTVRGHIDGVIGMVEDEVYCPDVMKQVAALQASLEKSTAFCSAITWRPACPRRSAPGRARRRSLS